MREAGFEPTTSASGGQRSIQLSYSRRSTSELLEAKSPAGAVASVVTWEQKGTRAPAPKQAFLRRHFRASLTVSRTPAKLWASYTVSLLTTARLNLLSDR